MVETAEATVVFEDMGIATEIWGGTQANFVVNRPGLHGKEVAVVLNAPAAKFLSEALGRENTPEFQEETARRAGAFLVQKLANSGHHLDSLIFLSRAMLDADPEILAALR
jgi:hypothetical protein